MGFARLESSMAIRGQKETLFQGAKRHGPGSKNQARADQLSSCPGLLRTVSRCLCASKGVRSPQKTSATHLPTPKRRCPRRRSGYSVPNRFFPRSGAERWQVRVRLGRGLRKVPRGICPPGHPALLVTRTRHRAPSTRNAALRFMPWVVRPS